MYPRNVIKSGKTGNPDNTAGRDNALYILIVLATVKVLRIEGPPRV
jgi:hypothetical protein